VVILFHCVPSTLCGTTYLVHFASPEVVNQMTTVTGTSLPLLPVLLSVQRNEHRLRKKQS
jgi:hypothetical protein